MRLRDVDLPEELITAQNEGDLVVFAGSGVSFDPPSNLPDFEGLARQVRGPKDIAMRDGESPDVFLGRLADDEVDVEKRVRKIIGDPESEPSRLQHLLPRLFPSADAVRLVTTNFDSHFTSAVREKFEHPVDIFHAPALPLGRDFRGLVYLHGAVENPRSTLVLTDQDFSRAYLIDGWATDFLREMFAEFTVLFVGYSHEDRVVEYLGRGLGSDAKSRYALTHPGRDEFWERMGITPVHYPKRPEPDGHEALPEAVAAWVGLVELGAHEHEARIQQIVAGSPPQEPEPADYIATVLDRPTRLRFFVEHAESSEWLEWANEKGAFDPLFGSSGAIDDTAKILADWFARCYAVEHPVAAFGLLEEHGLELHPFLWRSLARRLTDEPEPPAEIFAQWIAILVQSAPSGRAGLELGFLLDACSLPEDRDAALLIFRRLIRPTLTFDRLLSLGVEERDGRVHLGADVQIEADHHRLHEAWEDLFVPHLDEVHSDVIQITGSQLSEAHDLLRTAGGADSLWDPMSYGRSAIEPHEQDRHPEGQDAVIDAARVTLEWMLEHNRDAGAAVITQWSKAKSPLLRRLAIHGLSRDPELSPDEALKKVMEKEWLYRTALKHEVFQLIARAYPDAGDKARREFIDHSLRADVLQREPEGPKDRKTIDYERYNLAVWLQRHAPECDLAQEHFRTIQQEHEEFVPRDHPDLSWYSSGVHWVSPQSPIPVEDLLHRSSEQWLDSILEYRAKEANKTEGIQDEDSYEGLLGATATVTERQPRRGLDLAAEAVRREVWDERLWNALLRGLDAAEIEGGVWHEVLELLRELPDLLVLAPTLGRLLRTGLEEESMPTSCLESVERLADWLFESAVEPHEEARGLTGDDWVTTSINRPGGYVTQIWLQALSRRQQETDDEALGLPDPYRERFEEVLRSDAPDAQYASVLLASQLPFLHYLDPEWTEANLIPLFDWESDPENAERAWHGFLVGGRFTEPLLELLLPHLVDSFGRIDDELKTHRRAFCQRLAAVALHSEVHPLDQQGWLPRFIEDADVESRELWTAAVGRRLGSMKNAARETVWKRWMRDYWSDRTEGVPAPLTDGEASRMVEWALTLEPVFDEAVELVCRVPVRVTLNRELLHSFRRSQVLEAETELSARLLLHLLESSDELTYECRFALDIAERLWENGLLDEVATRLCEQLVELGCTSAVNLQRQFQQDD